MVSWEFYNERFYRDAFAILSNWEGLLLRLEFCLLWKRFIPSLLFFAFTQVTFWSIIFLEFHKIFILSSSLSLLALFDLGKNKFWPKLEGALTHFTGFNLKNEVNLALEKKEIWSLEEISYRAAKSFRVCVSAVNTFAPCRREYPKIFFLGTLVLGLVCIYLGTVVQEFHCICIFLNLALILPGLHYYRVFPRIWVIIKPVIQTIEAEFDRGTQLESADAREEAERQFWEPLAKSSMLATSGDLKEESRTLAGFSPSLKNPSYTADHLGEWSDDSMDGDSSEANFIREFLPRKLRVSSIKNERALNKIANELLSENPTKEQIDDWFSEVTEDPKRRQQFQQGRQKGTGGTRSISLSNTFDNFSLDSNSNNFNINNDDEDISGTECSESISNEVEQIPRDYPESPYELEVNENESDFVLINN